MYQDLPLFWRTNVFLYTSIIAVVIASAGADLLIGQSLPLSLQFASSFLISILPGTIWFILLYRSAARVNLKLPGPILVVALVGILFAAAVVHPFLVSLLDLENWLSHVSTFDRLLGSILLEGFPHAFFLYAAVVFTTWRRSEFSRRVDGALFAVTAAITYSSTLNVLFVIDHPTLLILSGNLRLLSMQAAILTPSLMLGLFIGQNRFEDMPPYYLSMGVASFALVNGLLLYAGSELNNTSLGIGQPGFSPWPGLVVNMIVLAIALVVSQGLIQRQNDLIEGRIS